MQIAFMLYAGFTPLDVVGPFQVLAAVPGAKPVLVAEERGAIVSDSGCSMIADRSLAEVSRPEIVVVPGSLATFLQEMHNETVLDWLRQVATHARYVTSVCTGSLILAGAGLLAGKRANTHWAARHLLAAQEVELVSERIVIDDRTITSAGVSAGIDMALELARLLVGDDVAGAMQLGIEYDPQPPLDKGSPETAGPNTVQAARLGLAARGAGWALTG